MYARNFRRREVSQRKKEGSSSMAHLDQKQDTPVSSHSDTTNKTYVHSTSPTASSSNSGANNNPSDFCNELLTAASIIESQNTTAGSSRNCECKFMVKSALININRTVNVVSILYKLLVDLYYLFYTVATPVSQSQHKVKVGDSHVIHKQEAIEEEEGNTAVTSNHHQQQEEPMDDEEDDTPIHFVYDKDSMVTSRDASNAWQVLTILHSILNGS